MTTPFIVLRTAIDPITFRAKLNELLDVSYLFEADSTNYIFTRLKFNEDEGINERVDWNAEELVILNNLAGTTDIDKALPTLRVVAFLPPDVIPTRADFILLADPPLVETFVYDGFGVLIGKDYRDSNNNLIIRRRFAFVLDRQTSSIKTDTIEYLNTGNGIGASRITVTHFSNEERLLRLKIIRENILNIYSHDINTGLSLSSTKEVLFNASLNAMNNFLQSSRSMTLRTFATRATTEGLGLRSTHNNSVTIRQNLINLLDNYDTISGIT